MPQFADGDKEIIRFLAEYVNLRARDLAELTGRETYVMRRRLRALGGMRHVRFGEKKGEQRKGLGYVNYILEGPEEATAMNELERVHFLTQKGWDAALELGFTEHRVGATNGKSWQNLPHDMKLTEIHLALHRRYGVKLHWFQYRPYIYTRWGDSKDDFVKPDAFFWLDLGDRFPAFFVELENNRETMHEADGDVIAKMRRFSEFAKGHFQAEEPFVDFSDFRVAIYRLSPTLARNMAAKAKRVDDSLATRRFWLTDIPSAIRGDERFITPKDYDKASYSLDVA